MALHWPAPAYIDGDFTVAEPISLPQFQSPVRDTTEPYIFTQDWMQLLEYWKPTPLGAAHPYDKDPVFSGFRLASEGPRQDAGGGIVRWQRTYAKVPASHDDYETHSYPFIGFVGSRHSTGFSIETSVTGRPRVGHVINSRVQHDYFLIKPPAIPGDIPVLKALRYFAGDLPENPVTGLETDFIMDQVGSVPPTSPSRTTYDEWMANAIAHGFRSGAITSNDPTTWATIVNPGQFIAEDSRIARWNGQIFMRQTRFILAQ